MSSRVYLGNSVVTEQSPYVNRTLKEELASRKLSEDSGHHLDYHWVLCCKLEHIFWPSSSTKVFKAGRAPACIFRAKSSASKLAP